MPIIEQVGSSFRVHIGQVTGQGATVADAIADAKRRWRMAMRVFNRPAYQVVRP